jgi:glycosyltransferase involved in cell wall biosynthesis
VAQVISTGTKFLRPREEIALHRSEGFGRGMAEALQLGVDVIATAYSGNTDFCADGHVWGGAGSRPCR